MMRVIARLLTLGMGVIRLVFSGIQPTSVNGRRMVDGDFREPHDVGQQTKKAHLKLRQKAIEQSRF